MPKFFKPQSVPCAMKTAIEKELDRLETERVLERISLSEYASPIVAVPKYNDSVRICGNYKRSINPSMYVDQYPLPKPEEMFAEVAGEITKLDLVQAYLRFCWKKNRNFFVAVNTHRELYQKIGKPFGMNSPAVVF